ncbi:hypothetical protein FQA39_LY17303 [Lamprigera yunnana]|nr:hypothetical protein FQA39_LY17303 [Lamprigera yunnana]
MYWGLIMEPKRRYTQTVQRPFHISMAALDIFSGDDEPTQLMLYFEERNYLLCTLQKGKILQCPLDLNFETGDEVVFATNGNSNIHLSGYLQDLDDYIDEEEEEELHEVEELKTKKERKKKLKADLSEALPPTKKSKLVELLAQEYTSDDEDESYIIPKDDGGDDEELEEEEESEEEDDEVDEEDQDMEENESGESSLSDEEVEKPKKQMNGEKNKSQKKRKQEPNLVVTPKSEKKAKHEKTPKQDGQQKNAKPLKGNVSSMSQQKKTLEGGVVIEDLKVGDGSIAKSGKLVQVYYEGRLKQNNKLFDQSNKGAGFKFRIGKQEVIKGWDVGVMGMKIGGRRRITCPPAMAYGPRGSPPAIPPNSTLVFEVELKNVI